MHAFDEHDRQHQSPLPSQPEQEGVSAVPQHPPAHTRKPPDTSTALKLMHTILESVALLFHDQFEESYLAPMGDGTKVMRLRSKAFRKWFHHMSYQILGKPVNHHIAVDVMNTLDGFARHEGPRVALSVRVAATLSAFWYDLGSDAVRIEPGAWSVESRPPILFQRFSHQQAQVAPVRGGSLDLLDPLLPSSLGPEQRLLFKVSLITGLVPKIPQTVDVIFGDHGSAKSTLLKLKKSLLDPSVIDELTPPTSLGEFMQLLAHHWFVPLGNLTALPTWMSDVISRASTGSAFAKRELYTDSDDVIYRFYRIIGLNGINLVAERADLLDRALLFGDLERIPQDKRKEDTAVWAQFEAIKPQVLGAMFEALARAMDILPTLQLSQVPRMADFARWGCAVAQAIGSTPEMFLTVYLANIAGQHDEAIEASPIGTVLVAFMAERKAWEGSPSALLDALHPLAEDLKLDRHRLWPKNANWVWRRIKEVRVNLQEKGITCEMRRDEGRTICVCKSSKNAVDADTADG